MINFKAGSSNRGSALVEFAFVIIILLTLLFGIIEFARAMYAYHWVSYAAHSATRYASVRGSSCKPVGTACPVTNADVTTYVKSILSSGIYVNASNLAATTTWPGATGNPAGCDTTKGTNSPGCPVKVVVRYTYGFNLIKVSATNKIDMTSTSQLTISQ